MTTLPPDVGVLFGLICEKYLVAHGTYFKNRHLLLLLFGLPLWSIGAGRIGPQLAARRGARNRFCPVLERSVRGATAEAQSRKEAAAAREKARQ